MQEPPLLRRRDGTERVRVFVRRSDHQSLLRQSRLKVGRLRSSYTRGSSSWGNVANVQVLSVSNTNSQLEIDNTLMLCIEIPSVVPDRGGGVAGGNAGKIRSADVQ